MRTPIAPYPCPICEAPPHRRERLRDAFELCTRCGFAIRLDDTGTLIGWATTNQSHPRGVRAAALLLVAVLGSVGCAQALTARPGTGEPRRVLYDESWSADTQLCVLTAPFVATKYPVACLSLGDLRAQLRSRQAVSSSESSVWSVRP